MDKQAFFRRSRMLRHFKYDKRRYRSLTNNRPIKEPSIVLIYLFRINSSISGIKYKFIKFFPLLFLIPIYKFVSVFLGISLPRRCKIGPGLVIFHFGGIAINSLVSIGENCTLRNGVTIGNKNRMDDVPTIGNNVSFGSGCVVIGEITIGDNVDIGANAVVLTDVPDNHIAVGNPAIVKQKRKLNK